MTSTININIPATASALASSPVRDNFTAAANDINSIQTQTNTSILTLLASPALTNSRHLVAGTNMSFVDTGPGGTLILNATDADTGTVTSVSVVSVNGVSGSVANPTTTPAITLTLGDITPHSIVATTGIQGTQLISTIITGTPPLVVASTTQIANLYGARSVLADTITLVNDATDSTSFVTFSGTATGGQALKTNAGFTYDATTNTVGATTFSGAFIGAASQITVATESSDATCFPIFVNSSTGNLAPKSNAGLIYDSTTNNLAATTFTGALAGNANTATTSTNIQTQNESSDTTCFPVFVTASGTQALPGKTNTTLIYNASTGALGTTSFSGAGTGLTGTAASLIAGGVSNATFTTALTIDTGTVTIHGNAANTSALTLGAGASSIAGSNTGDQTITLTGAVTGSGTGSFATTIATPGTLTVASTNSTVTAHTHAVTSSSAPGAAASLLATDASGIIGNTGTRIVKGWFTDLTVTNAISGSITGNAGTVTTNANLTGAVTSSGNATSLGSFTSAQLATALTDETGSGASVFANSPIFVTPTLGAATATSLYLGGSVALATYTSGVFTPVWTGLTIVGTPTYSAVYTKIGSLVYFTINISSTVTTASTAGTTFFTGLPFATSGQNYVISAANAVTIVSYGNGLTNGAGTTFTPTWGATANVIVSGTYQSNAN